MRMCKSTAVTFFVSVTLWIVCATANAQMDEAQALAALKFDRPVVVTFSTLLAADPQGFPTPTPESQIVAFLNKSGHFNEVPHPAGPPWWRFSINTTGGTSNGVTADIPVAKRVITDRSSSETWSEGSTKFYARTITYTIEFDSKIRALGVKNILPLTLRLVEYRDPAVGDWRLLQGGNRGTRFNHDEYMSVRTVLAAAGSQYLGLLRANIANAIQASRNATQDQLATSGTVEKGPFPGTILIKKHNLLLYLGDAFPGMQNLTVDRLKNYCSDLRVGNISWHLPMTNELHKLTQEKSLDTPDHRLWGELGGMIFVPADTLPLRFNYGGNKNYYEGQAFLINPQTSEFQYLHGGFSVTGPTSDSAIISQPVKALCIASNEQHKLSKTVSAQQPQSGGQVPQQARQAIKTPAPADRGPEWAEADDGAGMNWAAATSYCASKGNGWSLPTTTELQSNYQSGQATPCGSYTCKVTSKSRLTGPWFWTNEPAGSSNAWAVLLGLTANGPRQAMPLNGKLRALCVRRP